MAFGGQMHHGIGVVQGKDAVQRRAVADVGLFKAVQVRSRDRGHIVQTGGIGQGVEVHHLMPARHGQPHDRRADEARARR